MKFPLLFSLCTMNLSKNKIKNYSRAIVQEHQDLSTIPKEWEVFAQKWFCKLNNMALMVEPKSLMGPNL